MHRLSCYIQLDDLKSCVQTEDPQTLNHCLPRSFTEWRLTVVPVSNVLLWPVIVSMRQGLFDYCTIESKNRTKLFVWKRVLSRISPSKHRMRNGHCKRFTWRSKSTTDVLFLFNRYQESWRWALIIHFLFSNYLESYWSPLVNPQVYVVYLIFHYLGSIRWMAKLNFDEVI